MRPLPYALPFLALATVPLGFVLGGAWAWLTVAVMPVCLTALDGVLGDDQARPPGRDLIGYRLLPWLYIPLQLAVTAWALWAASRDTTTLVQALGLTASVGATTGVFGILAAHEMVHSRRRAERGLGLILLASIGYMHFRIAHIPGHHRRAATFEDSTTARRGESAYGFIGRAVAGQVREGWTFETARLARQGLGPWRFSNRMIQYAGVEAVIFAGAAAFLGRYVWVFFTQAVLSVVLLELFNYVAHYGLRRRRLGGGGLERMGLAHSWNTSRRMNNWSLFNMGRHSDHHRFGARHYQCLESLPGSPQLPTGYAGTIFLALIPPLWRRVMDPRVDHWMGQSAPMVEASASGAGPTIVSKAAPA